MIFTSFKFLVFICVTVLGYFLFPKKYRWLWLLGASYYFYLSASVKYSVFLIFSTVITYFAALVIERVGKISTLPEWTKEEKKQAKKKAAGRQKLILAAVLLVNFGVLFSLKYYNFAASSVANLAGVFGLELSPAVLNIAVPVGISFYTFQVTGYLIDVYRTTCSAQKNFLKYALFVSFFPQIMQGPIGRYNDLAPGLYEGHKFDYNRAAFGLQRMVFGFFEKLVIADRLAILVDTVWANYAQFGRLQLLLACFFYAVQIYADFAGYMDIALGCAQIMGIPMAENFDAPYFSKSVPEFWRRWHMTLGSWFKDYLFYPVLRSGWCTKLAKDLKKKFGKTVSGNTTTAIALFFVWMFTGLWHGASWHYVAWGVYYGVLIILSMLLAPLFDWLVAKLHLDRSRPSYMLVQGLKTFAIVCVGYILFRSDSMSAAAGMIGAIFRIGTPVTTPLSMGLDSKDMIVAVVGVLVLFIVDIFRYRKFDLRQWIGQQGLWLRWMIYLVAIFAVLIFGIYGPAYSASSFIYFQF